MNDYIITNRNIGLEKLIAKLFIFFLPFKMFSPLYPLSNITHGLANTASFLFIIIGLLLVLLRKKLVIQNGYGGKIFKNFIIMWLVCDLTSLVMAVLLHDQVGTIGGEDTFSAVLKKILFSFAYILFVYYGIEVWKLLSKDEITNVITKSIDFCIIVGMIQILILFKISFAVAIYDFINTGFNAFSSSEIIRTNKIAVLSIEPAYASGYLCAFFIPFLLSRIIYGNNTNKTIIRLILCIMLLYFTKSTTGYTLFLVEFVVFIYVFLAKSKISLSHKIISVFMGLSALALLIIIIASQVAISSNITSVFDKLLSNDNATSADRKLFIIVDSKIFFNYPLLGVGNGNQGFFYQQYTPDWMLSLYTAAGAYSRAGEVLVDGGPFWLAFISGYGIVGLSMLFFMVKNSINIIKWNRGTLKFYYYFYYLSIFLIFATGTVATMGDSYYMWFILALPMSIKGVTKDG